MAEKMNAFTRAMQREKLISALSELTDLYNDGFGDGSDVLEDGEALEGAMDAIDDVLAAMDAPDDEDDDDDDDDEAVHEDEGGFVDRR